MRGEGDGSGSARAAGRRLKEDPTCGSHMSVTRGGEGGLASAGPFGPARPRGREKMLGRIRPNDLKEGFKNFFN